MPAIRSFSPYQYAKTLGSDISALIAPPFDVLDEHSKAALVAKHPNNVVSIDLPYLPPKAVGPDAVYEQANQTLEAWISAGILTRATRPGFFAYTQAFQHNGLLHHRKAFFATVKISPFEAGHVVPHEKTYRGAIEDRLKLMRATRVQMSPIFGLYSDSRHEIANLLFKNLAKPDITATLDGVRNDLWAIHDAEIERQIIDFLGRKPIYIADGHHRYTTALTYLQELEKQNNGPLPPQHPANYCMFALVGMQDEGLLISPTHRLLGNIPAFNIADFTAAVSESFTVTETPVPPDRVAEFIDVNLTVLPTHTFGLYDGRSKKLYQLTCTNLDVLKPYEPLHGDAWRRLDVAILQRFLIEEILQPLFAGGGEVSKAYTANASQIVPKTDGQNHQIALLLKSTPLGALEQLAVQHEVMPQKSTYFYPKLATGLLINPVG